MTRTYPKVKRVGDWTIKAVVGAFVKPEGWEFARPLLLSDWNDASYYLQTTYNKKIAVNIYITGQKIVYKKGFDDCIAVQIEFVGDGEPNSYTYGFMEVRKHNGSLRKYTEIDTFDQETIQK